MPEIPFDGFNLFRRIFLVRVENKKKSQQKRKDNR